jgi:hypothetical protein
MDDIISEKARADIRNFLEEFEDLRGEKITPIKDALRALIDE